MIAACLFQQSVGYLLTSPGRPAADHRVVSRSGTVSMASPLADIAATSKAVRVEGDTLKTWDIGEQAIERVQLDITSDGRPCHAEVQLWHTPAYIPTKFSVYTEDGKIRPVTTIIETPKHPKTVAVYNTGPGEFPFMANVANTGLEKAVKSVAGEPSTHVQGGQITSYTFGPEVDSVQICLSSADIGERNMKAKIELTQGPNQVKQTVEMYCSSGYKNPFYIVMQTPGSVNTIRVINQNNVEFPFDSWVLPYESNSSEDASKPVLGGM